MGFVHVVVGGRDAGDTECCRLCAFLQGHASSAACRRLLRAARLALVAPAEAASARRSDVARTVDVRPRQQRPRRGRDRHVAVLEDSLPAVGRLACGQVQEQRDVGRLEISSRYAPEERHNSGITVTL